MLDKRFFMYALQAAQRDLEHDGELVPMLLVHLVSGAHFYKSLHMPNMYEKKKAFFRSIGATLRRTKGPFTEAVMLMESWYVDGREAPNAKDFSPSRHPCRHEAIVLIGRNADNSRQSSVVQPFTRNANNKPVWGTTPIALYDHPVSRDLRVAGLLDFLFPWSDQA